MIPKLLQSSSTPHLFHPPEYTAFIEALKTNAFDTAEPPKKDKDKPTSPIFRDQLAHIMIDGPIVHKATWWEKYFGAIDPLDIQVALKEASAQPVAEAIILHIDSPGGTVAGTPELGELIDEIDRNHKPILAYVDGLCASAAYWLASQCRQINATRSSVIGSIGVYLPFIDFSEWLNKDGIYVDIIKNTEGIHKAAGFPGTSLTEEQRQALVEDVDEIFGQFSTAITAARGNIPSEAQTGRTFSTFRSIDFNLIDEIAPLDETQDRALRLANETAI